MGRREDIAQAIEGTVHPHAFGTTRKRKFPRAGIDALARAGVLGLTVSRRYGGGGQGLAEAARVIERVALACASTATILQAHYAAVAVLEPYGSPWLRRQLGTGGQLATLALAEAGGTANPHTSTVPARPHGGVVDLHGRKCWVPAAGEADCYLWSSGALDGGPGSTLWPVPADAPGLLVPATPARFAPRGWDPAGLPGVAAAPVTADPVRIPAEGILGTEGEGGTLTRGVVARWFIVLGAALSLGLMRGAIEDAVTAARSCPAGSPSRTAADRAIDGMRDQVGSMRGRLARMLDPSTPTSEVAGTALPALRAAALDGALNVTALARMVCHGGPASAAAELRCHDARSAATLDPFGYLTPHQETASHHAVVHTVDHQTPERRATPRLPTPSPHPPRAAPSLQP